MAKKLTIAIMDAPYEKASTTTALRSGSRVGIYFAETGASQRASAVIYDRAHSAVSELDPAAVAWDTTSFDCVTLPPLPGLSTRTGIFVLVAPSWAADEDAALAQRPQGRPLAGWRSARSIERGSACGG